ncbi:MAG: energy transducer TonB [Sphingomonadales bacterium]|nr:energy transducer TonB [Sphingomonadales bacterium]
MGNSLAGVLEIDTRAPSRRYSATFNASVDSDALVNCVISDAARDALAGATLPDHPKFTKYRIGGTVDIPVTDRLALLFGANHSYAEVEYTSGVNYGYQRSKRVSSSDNYLAKAIYDVSDATSISGQFSYTPYVSEYSNANGVDNVVRSKGGGYLGRLGVNHDGSIDWSLDATWSNNDTGRTAPPNNYLIPRVSSNGGFCTATNCTRGFIGDLDQAQENLGINGKLSVPLGEQSAFRAGFSYNHVEAHRERPQDNYAYLGAYSNANVVCTQGNTLDCVTGQYALTTRQTYAAYDVTVSVDTFALWGEFNSKFGPVDLRLGGRYDRDSFLGNDNFSPRASVTVDLPVTGWSITGGANRYYGRSMLGYAIREKVPNLTIYSRVFTTSAGQRLYGNSWTLSSATNAVQYGLRDLDTPYSDELTAAVTGRLLGGTARVKGIMRWGKDEFVRTPQETSSGTNALGNPITIRTYYLSNEGRSKYRGVSLEWVRTFGDHSIGLNTNFSKTSSSNDNYIDDYDDTLFEELPVLYNGELVTKGEIMINNRRLNMASPFILNGSWTARWFNERLTTNLNLRFRDGFSRIEDTGVNQTVSGTSYDVYGLIAYKASIDANLNAQLELIREGEIRLALDMRVSNLLNKVPVREWDDEGEPYQMGRAFWLGAKLKF